MKRRKVTRQQSAENRMLHKAHQVLRRLGYIPVTWQSPDSHLWVESGFRDPAPLEIRGSKVEDPIPTTAVDLKKNLRRAAGLSKGSV
jgi:hypothetical protein